MAELEVEEDMLKFCLSSLGEIGISQGYRVQETGESLRVDHCGDIG